MLTDKPLALRRRGGGRGERCFPYEVGPRRLGDTLVEFSTRGAWHVDDLDAAETVVAGPGRVFVVPAERRHALRMVEGGPMHSEWHMVALEDEIGRDALARLPRAFVLPASASSRARTLSKALSRGPAAGVAGRVAFQRLGLELAATILAHGPPAPAAPPRPPDDRIEAVVRFVRDRLGQPLTRRDLARQAHLSPTRFHYVFLDATGLSPMRYLLQQRTRHAQRLLLSTVLPSKTVGEQCGFASATHFARTFARQTGMSPLAYRAQMRGGGGGG